MKMRGFLNPTLRNLWLMLGRCKMQFR